ncbi:VOC family protein [Alkalihalobacillus sp. CinArs1]|uniref:VOC family protein n=1 Tax=Alkalihalobacillus sp. CinArs1 TaxID=2995314 RepID=UPI0022DD3C47|nr:VOC family protein [Alkalihalobacillus sp. CinArs1]
MFEMTIQLRVSDMEEGLAWYKELFQRDPDFVPHEGFVEWEMLPGSWLQLAEGTPTEGSGPLRLGVEDISAERERVMKKLNVAHFEIHSREEVPVKWGTFTDPWGNRLGFYEYLNKEMEAERMQTILG